MRLVVCLKEVIDTRVTLGFGRVGGELVKKGLPFKLNPNDAEALAEALDFKRNCQDAEVEITVVSIGPKRTEEYLRDGLALGADGAVRVDWHEEDREMSPAQKARVLAKVVSVLGADLIVSGVKSLDNGSGQVGPLIAASLGLPCVYGVTSFYLETDRRSIAAVRTTADSRELVRCSPPAVLAVAAHGRELPYAAVDEVLKSHEAKITVLTIQDVGILPSQPEGEPTRVLSLSFPRPRPKSVVAPDSSLPAFDRILALLQGGISRRAGKLLQGEREGIVDQLFDLLKEEDVLKAAPGAENGAKDEPQRRA